MANRQPAGGPFFMPPVERPFDEKSDIKAFDMEGNGTTLAPSLRKILQMNAQTSEEKFKVLDARDKLYKIMKDKEPALKRGALIATCTDMCPEKERLLRDAQGRGSVFEMTNFSKNSTFNHSLAVKEYARSSADQEEPLPHDLRPVHVLSMTMSHLLHNVVDYCELSDENLEDWYLFMWDRTRALRKELTQQGVCNLESVTLVEQCARFHIHSAERLIDQDSSIYDDKINTENLTKCLQTLKYMYKDLAKEDVKCPNEPEFVCYSLLLNLNNSSVFTELSSMPSYLLISEPVKFALNLMAAWETKNYIRFFNLVKQTTYLNCCLLRRYFGEMRLYAIKTMIRSYCTKNYSPQILISRFVEILNFEGEKECLNFLSYCNFGFYEIDGKTVVNFDRLRFQNPTTTITSGRAYLFIEAKKERPLSIVMAGGVMPPRLFENHVPHTSFTPNGDLNPDAMPQKELLEFFSSSSAVTKIDSSKSTSPSFDIFSERERSETVDLAKPEKEGTPASMFSFKDKNTPSTNIFGADRPTSIAPFATGPNIFGNNFAKPSTGSFGNIFDSPVGAGPAKSIFGNQGTSALFGNTKSPAFGTESKLFPTPAFPPVEPEKPRTDANNVIPSFFNSGNFVIPPPKIPDPKLMEAKLQEERARNERLEKERLLREKEEEEKRKRKEEEEREKMRLERQRLEEESRRRELERERKRKEEEERRKEEIARREKEERIRREEAARQERLREIKHLEELKKLEETRRRKELEHKEKVDLKMSDLKGKMEKWKTKIIFDKWRMKTWASIEDRKMKEYFKEVKVKYPPVCTEEMLNGNPYGLVIPSTLTFEKFRDWKKQLLPEPPQKLKIVTDDLPLLKVNCILGKPLETLAKNLGKKLDPFPWKLVISVPDHVESPDSWKSIETFVEMHFVEHFSWQFGVQKGPLYCRGGNRGPFRFHISIRRLRGTKLYEGSECNPSATTGSNALIFFISECGNEISRERLKAVLNSRSPLPKIPVIIIALNGQPKQDHLNKLLDLDAWEKCHISKHFAVSILDSKHQPVVQLTKCLQLAVSASSPPSFLRVSGFSNFFSGTWIDSLWLRVEIGLSNFKIILQEPKILIEFYNSCIEELAIIFLDKTNSQQTVLGEEFSECNLKLPSRTPVYESKLKSLLDRLKLPHWPAETPKSCHQLNYRIHQYCKKVRGENKGKIKNLKWVLYRIIRQSLSWKGLDIYCDEDIYDILTNFPWIRVFQEVSRVITRQLCEEVKEAKEMVIIYDVERIERFSFESSFISKFLRNSKKRVGTRLSHLFEEEDEEDELDEVNPRLEKDSVVYSYSAAIERESNKRRREECVEEGLDVLFSSPAGKRIVLEEVEGEEEKEQQQPKGFDFSGIQANFQSLNERLDVMKKTMMENFKTLTDIQSEIQ